MKILIFIILILLIISCSNNKIPMKSHMNLNNQKEIKSQKNSNNSLYISNKTFYENDSVYSVTTTPDGQYIVSGSKDNTIKLWNIASGKLIRVFKGHKKNIYSVTVTSNGRYIISGSDDYTMKLWNIESGKLIQTFIGNKNNIRSVAITPNNRYIASNSSDSTIELWDIKSGKVIKTFKGHESTIYSIAITPNGQYIVSGSKDNTIKLWDIASGKLIKTFKGHKSTVSSIAITPNGYYIISSSWDNTIKLWDIASGKIIKTFNEYEKDISSIAIAPNGHYIVSGSWNKTVKLWNIETGKVIKTFKGHKGSIYSVAITPNSRYIISGSVDKTIKLWDIERNIEENKDIEKFFDLFNNKNMITNKIVHPFQSIEKITQYITNLYLKPKDIYKEISPPKIKKPTLPPPPPKLIKNEYENQAMFQKRVNQTISKREEKVKALQKQYRVDVENRNKKIEDIQKRYLKKIKKVKIEQIHKKSIITQKIVEFQKDVFKIVMGNFVLEKRSYDAENQILYATMKATRANYSKKISLKVSLDEVKSFIKHIKDIRVDAKFDFIGNKIVLKSIDAKYNNKTYMAMLTEKDFEPKKIEVAIKDKKVKFDSAKQIRLTLQNPNLKDTYQIEALAYSDGQEIRGVNYQDDIPQLLQSIKQAHIDNKKWLFVIGAEEYDNTDKVTYSRRSAEIFIKVAKKSLGITERNSYALIGNSATSGAIEDKLNRMLENVKEGDSIYFFYSGHGIPVLPNRVPYLLPKDKIPDYIGKNSFFKLTNIYNLLSSSKATKVIAIMDSCFSGSTDGKSIFKGVAGSVLVPKKVTFNHNKMVVFTAGRDKQFSNMYPKRGHRLFSYFLMKALLEGKRNVSDIYNKVYPNVKSVSNGFGDLKRQEPTIEGNEKLSF